MTKNSVNQSIRVCDTKRKKGLSVVRLRRAVLRYVFRTPLLARAAVLSAPLLLAGCSSQTTLGYYWQAAAGQMQLLSAAQPVATLVQDPQLPPALRQRLERTQQIRNFASQQLALPDNASYRRYADTGRTAVVWNVVAAPVDQLELHRWCFAVVGCVGYRGYFGEADARAQAALLRDAGWEVSVYGVPAYSTLGWLNWLGGDPLLNTFIRWAEPDVAGLIFHELAHQLIYVKDDTAFNESFATAVQRAGTAQWLHAAGTPALRSAFTAGEARRQQWRALTRTTRAALSQLYAAQASAPLSPPALAARKQALLQDFRQRYAALRTGWHAQWQAAQPTTTATMPAAADPWALTDAWVAGANNASFAALGVYEDWAPAFETMHQQAAGDWPRFYDAVRALAAQPAAARHAALKALLAPAAP